MQTIEIYYNRKWLIPTLCVFAAITLAGIYFTYFFGKIEVTTPMMVAQIVGTAVLARVIFLLGRKLAKNEPVLTLTKTEIIVNEKGTPYSLLWPQVLDWRIERKNTDANYYIILETADKTRKVDITWLDKKPKEIEEIFKTYKKPLLREARL